MAPPPGGMASTAPVLASDVTADNPPQIPGFLHLRGNPGGKVAAVFLDPQEPPRAPGVEPAQTDKMQPRLARHAPMKLRPNPPKTWAATFAA